MTVHTYTHHGTSEVRRVGTPPVHTETTYRCGECGREIRVINEGSAWEHARVVAEGNAKPGTHHEWSTGYDGSTVTP
jgi:hypothetical protein